jgi:hypothetical protein
VTYFRSTFRATVSAVSQGSATLRLYVDDGAVVYINNVEVVR